MSKPERHPNTIAINKKAHHNYQVGEYFEAGLVLEGWEVKSLRSGKIQLTESYILLKHGEAWLFGALITPLPTVSTHVRVDARRNRKLLLQRKELARLIGAKERKGAAIIPISLYWKNGKIKLRLAIAHGKKLYDKRHSEKERDWQRQKARLLRPG